MKKVAIMQPYFMPYLGYFSLIKNTDLFILFDTPQYIRHGWIERNRVLKQGEGWLYIKVPLLKHNQSTPIKDVSIDNKQDWKIKIIAQLEHYKKNAPYYDATLHLLNEIFKSEYKTITDLNAESLRQICNYIGIRPKIEIFSKMELEIETPSAPDEWALNICKAMGGVEEYWNPPGGQEFFISKKYEDSDIVLRFQKVNLLPYDQRRKIFESGLSILDVMMFNPPEEINKMLDNYELV